MTAETQRRPTRLSRSVDGWTGALGRGAVGAAVVALAFEGFARLELVDPRLFPPATAVIPRALQLMVDPEFLVEVWATLSAVLGGIAVSSAIAIPLGVLLGSYHVLATALMPIIDALRSVPGIAIIPLLVLILGKGLEMQVTLVAIVSAWPLLFNTMYGVRGVDRVAIETARIFRTPRLMLWRRVALPHALPLILTGLRVALATALTVAIASEISVGTSSGVGYFILRASYAGFNGTEVFAAVTLAGVLGYLLNWFTIAVTSRSVAWDIREAR